MYSNDFVIIIQARITISIISWHHMDTQLVLDTRLVLQTRLPFETRLVLEILRYTQIQIAYSLSSVFLKTNDLTQREHEFAFSPLPDKYK